MSEVNLRKTCHNHLVAYLNQLKNHATVPLSYVALTTIQSRARAVMVKCEAVQDKLIGAASDDAAIAVQESAFFPIEATYQEVENKVAEALLTVPVPTASGGGGSSTSSGPTPATTINVRLPAMELPTFDGSYARWTSFRDLFVAAVDTNTQLSKAQKLQYLKSSLQGEPGGLISAMEITDANYVEAWKVLKERYDNKREIVRSLVVRFLSHKHLVKESAQDLKLLLDTFCECVRALKALSCPTEHWDDLLVVILEEKLDSATRREWAIRQTGTALPTFEDISKFLSSHIRGLLASGVASNPNSQQHVKGKQIKVHHAASSRIQCHICNGNHKHHQCAQLLAKTPSERSDLIKQQRLCFNCLSKDHPVRECSSKGSCRKCGKRHHTLLHRGDGVTEKSHPPVSSSSSAAHTQQYNQQHVSTPSVGSNYINSSSEVILKTAVVLVPDKFGKLQPCRLFIDGGSQSEFARIDCVKRLQLPRQRGSVTVEGFGGTYVGRSKGQVELTLVSRYDHTKFITISAHVMPRCTNNQPKFQVRKQKWNHLEGLQLADPEWFKPAAIDITVGIRHLHKILGTERRIGPDNAPVVYDSIFGWIIGGAVEQDNSKHPVLSYHISVDPDLDFLRRFWEIEEPPQTHIQSDEERLSEQHFASTHSRDSNGKFHVSIPFNGQQEKLGYSREAAVKRLQQVERRLGRHPEYRKQYIDFMKEYFNLGHMMLVPKERLKELPGKTCYLPHHFVVNDGSSTTKLRVVFDGSAKTTSGLSLNDTMMVGGTIQDDLYDHLLKLRFFPIVLKGDITKMFRQFILNPPHQEYHRIVWREDPCEPIRDYWLLTVTYGTAAATYLATRCVQQLGKDVQATYPVAATSLINNFFVDDLVDGANTPGQAIQLYHQLTSAVESAGMELRKWSTNHPDVLAAIPEEKRELDPQSFGENPVKTLGIHWYPATDMFQFSTYEFENGTLTKRMLLSNLARVFDPLGLISCVTVRAKLLLQELWKCGVDWDEQVPAHIATAWEEYKEDIKHLVDFQIPRRVTTDGDVTVELHAFADASERGLGSTIYLRSVSSTGILVHLVTSKTRVAPIKPVTIPRLELCAALEAAKLVNHVKTSLNIDCPIYCWSDSTITLRWLSTSPRRWKTFVCHRVTKIQQLTPIECWRHVPGTQNPADLASRGVSVHEIKFNRMWFQGPSWLSEHQLPCFSVPATDIKDDEERKVPILANHVEVQQFPLLEKFSSLVRLKRVTAHILRFFHRLRKREVSVGPIQPSELESSFTILVKYVQQQEFAKEIKQLELNKQVANSSKLKSLNPFLDSDGVLRVGGRIRHAALPENVKHPKILPGNSHLVYLLVHHYHHSLFHAGFLHVWSSLQREFWITRGRDRTRHIIRSCVVCRRYRAAASEQLMGELPEARVTPGRAFLRTGVDFCGPFILKNPVGRVPKSYKAYVCVFVCMVTKAIHLEAVSSLSTDAFLDCFRRFVSRRGLCSDIFSDCGTNFVGADRELKSFLMSAQAQDGISNHLSTASIRWHFNPPSSPHHGGLWEAAVKSAKYHLRRVIGDKLLTYESFATILCQIEGVLNSRPLTPLSGDPEDFSALTPGHFLIGESLTAVPERSVEDVPVNRLNRYQALQQQLQHFWRRWSREYLQTLQQRNKWMWDKENIQVGAMVLLKEDSSPGSWKMGRVTEVHPGEDGKVRVVTVKTSSSLLQRPIVKLVPLC